MNKVLNKFTFIKSKRQAPKLKHLLTRARFCEEEGIPTIKRCNRGNCALCAHLLEGNNFKSKSGFKVTVKFSMSCDVKNVVYVIICKVCKEEYVGVTNDLRKRMSIHRNHIRDPSHRILKVSAHIENCVDAEPKFNVFPLFKMNTDGIAPRRKKEKDYIKLLKPKLN